MSKHYWMQLLAGAARIRLYQKPGAEYNLENLENFVYKLVGRTHSRNGFSSGERLVILSTTGVFEIKSNMKSVRMTDEVFSAVEEYRGNGFNEKFENAACPENERYRNAAHSAGECGCCAD